MNIRNENIIMSRIIYHVILLLLSLYYTESRSSRNVPSALWNIKGNSLQSRPVTAFEESTKNYMDNFLKEILGKESTSMLVFLIDRLSLEDFSVEPVSATSNSTLRHLVEYLDDHPHVFLPSVKDPVKRLHDVNCGVEEVYLDKIVDEKFFRSISSALESSCVVILHLLGTEIMKGDSKAEGDFVGEFFQPSLSTSKKNVVGMFSASKPSWESSHKEHGASRSLLSSVESSDSNFINFLNCTIMYAENATVTFNQSINDTYPLFFSPDTEGSYCGNKTSMLQLTFSVDGKTENVEIRMTFNETISGWHLAESTVKTDDTPESLLVYEDVEAPDGFSYSCGKFVFETENSSTPITITMDAFQIQPFVVDGSTFSDSFDCVTYFTLPIWMGLFVAILFILILNTGIYALFSVKTMDRFDDPKGKSITVTPAVD